jgi:cytochrome c-type biogenesis protein CcmH
MRNTLGRALLRHLFAACLLLSAASALAVEPSEQLADPALEARARTLSASLRCLVCQNETIDESNAGLAHDIRVFLRERLVAGDTDAQAVKAIVDRYGEFVLLKPPLHTSTYVLWFGPLAILLAGLIGTGVWLRRRQETAEMAAPLSADEKTQLNMLLQENER